MPKKTAKKTSVEDLKKQLFDLQSKVEKYEAKKEPEEQAHPVFEVIEYYSWKAPERMFIPRNRKWYTYLFLLLLIIILILLFLKQFIIIAPIAALGFVTYVLASVPPHSVTHKLTNQGVTTENRSYLWSELYDFWVVKRDSLAMMHIDTNLNYPRRLILMLGEGDFEKIKEVMLQFIPFREVPKESFMDKAANFLSAKFHKIAS